MAVSSQPAPPTRAIALPLGALLRLDVACALGLAAIVATFSVVTADTRWLVVLGRTVAAHGIPSSVPFAGAPTQGWHDVPVLAELAFAGLYGLFGIAGLQLAQVVAAAVAGALVVRDARARGAGDLATGGALLLLAVGGFGGLVWISAQLFSLALFPALALLLRAESRAPSRAIWLVPVLLALWSNLHGAALTGFAVAGAYLVVERARREPLVAAGVLGASLAGLCATPQLWHTPAYYADVLGGEAARLGIGMWAPLSPQAPIDLLLIAAFLFGLVPLVRARPSAWEVAALVGLAALTVRTARGGIWLELFATPLVAAGLPRHDRRRPPIAAALAVAFGVALVLGLARGPVDVQASDRTVRVALADAHGFPVLAGPSVAEQVALAGGRVWVGNPIDAFASADQRTWLRWQEGSPAGDGALAHVRVVLAPVGSAAERRVVATRRFTRVATDAVVAVYVRR